MIKYNFTETYELNENDRKTVENINTYPYFTCNNNANKTHKVCHIKKTGKSLERNKFTVISSYVKITKKFIDIDTQKVKLEVEFFNGDKVISKIFDRSILTKSGIETLIQYGVCYDTDKPKKLLDYLLISEQFANIEYFHTQLGWSEIDGKKVFKSNKLISAEDFGLKSNYIGSLDLEPKGDRNKWFEMIKSEVIGNIPLTTVMLAGFASPLLGFLNEKYNLGSILFNLSNSSSKGKTTAAMLATSVFGNPAIDKSTMITFNATNNALVSFASKCNSHTIALDEAVISTASDVTKQLYTLCAGRDKLRLNTDSELKETASFSSIIISTAEFDLIPDSATNGIRARVFELKDTFTTSAENSVKIKSTVTENYGYAGNEFVEFLIKEKINNIEKDYIKCQNALLENYLKKNSVKGELTERVFSKLAIILQTAIYFDECFKIEINDKIFNYLLDIEKNIGKVSDRAQFLLECIRQSVEDNNKKYITETTRYPPDSPLGEIKNNGLKTEITILKSEAERIFQANNIYDAKSLLHILKTRGQLKCEKDRQYKKLKLNKHDSVRQNCYVFIVDYD